MKTDAKKLTVALKLAEQVQKPLGKQALPLLQAVLIRDGQLHATDMEVWMQTPLGGADEPMCVPAKPLRAAIGKITGDVEITRKGEQYRIVTETAIATLHGFDPIDFPLIVEPVSCPMPIPGWREAWEHCKRSIGRDATRPDITRVSIQNGSMVTTDSMRMSRYPLDAVDGLLLGDVARIAEKTKGDVSIAYGDAHTTVYVGDVVLTTRALDDHYPNAAQLFPNEREQSMVTDTIALAAAVAIVKPATMRTEKYIEPVAIQVTIERGSCMLHASENGMTIEQIVPCTTSDGFGELTIGLNAQYMLDALAPISGPVRLAFDGALRPVLFSAGEYGHLLMPISSK